MLLKPALKWIVMWKLSERPVSDFLGGDLDEVEVVSWYHIQSFVGEKLLGHPWECALQGAKFDDLIQCVCVLHGIPR